jgi:hypothetical protein
MISPPTDRLHKFLAIAGTALFILGVTIPLDRYDQSVRQFIEAKAKSMELGEAQLRFSKMLDEAQLRLSKEIESLKNPQRNSSVVAPDHATKLANGVDLARLETETARFEREIADLSVQAQKQLDLAEHAERIRAIWLVLGCICILGGMVLAALGFAMWWRQPEDER